MTTSLARARRGWHAVLVAATAATLITGCSSDGGSAPHRGPAGDYLLAQVASDALPVDIHAGPWFDPVERHFYNRLIVKVTHGEFVLGSDATFLFTIDVDINGDGVLGQNHVSVTGTYTLQGTTLTFTPLTAGYPVFQAEYRSGAVRLALDLLGKGTSLPYDFRR